MTPLTFCHDLNHDYEALHTAKEDAFWAAYMGLHEDPDAARSELEQHEKEVKRFLQDPTRLDRVRAQLRNAETDETRSVLEGWKRTLEAHVIESEEGRALAARIVDEEGKLARARGRMKLGYQVEGGEFVEANSIRLGTMLLAEKNEGLRRAAWDGLRSIESFVLEHGFLDVVRMRNRLARMMGAEDFYDWRVRRVEGMGKRQIFDLLDDLEERTRDAAAQSIARLRKEQGDGAAAPFNIRYHTTGDFTAEQDPFFPFSRALDCWGRSFAALGINYNGAELVLDLVDRKGKYENGFMHGPVPAWRDGGRYRPARIQFTANAIPGMVGSGRRATATLFHEGGHAAHFANIDMPAPCFSQEFAPTSVAFAELQSMFCDSLLGDADWQARYARTIDGRPISFALIEKGIRASQPYAAQGLRQALSIPYCERAIYELSDDELTAERVLAEIAAVERRLLGMERSPRPALSVPHLLAGESSAYYHGYIMAQMAVEQTRAFFLRRDGHLMDNPRIGPDLREVYWKPGNSRTFFEFVRTLTGQALSAQGLARRVNRSANEAVRIAKERFDRLPEIPAKTEPVELGARILVMHGQELIASTEQGGFAGACDAFAAWIEGRSADQNRN